MSSAGNSAAWLVEAKARPFQVKPAPMWTPEANEILVRNHALAINPVNGSIQAFAWWPMDYPTILGMDVAGEVAAVGPNVTRFKVGDRVAGCAVGMASKRNSDNAFQLYTILQTNMATPIPDDLGYEKASVIPLGLSTAACALFQDSHLHLRYPTSSPAQKPTGETLLVWGGASSVGCNAVQLAVAAGYEVIATASPRNFGLVKSLGATEVYDYNSPTVLEDLLAAFGTRTCAGAFDCVGAAAWKPVASLVAQSKGNNKFVATTKGGFPEPPEGVTMKPVFGTTLKDNDVGKAVYEDYLPKALASGEFVPAPEPMVIGTGLDKIQEGVDLLMKGVSAKKIVVTL